MEEDNARVGINGGGEIGANADPDQAVPGSGSSPASEAGSPSSSTPEGGFPWSRCVMGCERPQGEEEGEKGSGREQVVMLPCLHVLCSEGCVTKLASDPRLCCSKCRFVVTREELSNWINLEEEFLGKGMCAGSSPAEEMEVTLLCQNCVFDKVAIAYCPECPVTLCTSCAELHPVTRATQKHVITTDLSGARKGNQQQPTDPSACRKHPGQKSTHACLTCMEKVCGDCSKDHHDKTHEVIEIQAEKQKLVEKLRVAKQLKDKCGDAVTQIRKKCEDLADREWKKLMLEVNNQFVEMLRILKKRELEIKREAREQFLKKSNDLIFNRRYAEMGQLSTDEFIKTGEALLNGVDDIAVINYLRRSENYFQWLSGMEKKLARDFDPFVEKDMNFVLDSSEIIRDQEVVRKFCKVHYKNQAKPIEPGVIPTVDVAGSSTSASNGADAEDDVGTSQIVVNKPHLLSHEELPSPPPEDANIANDAEGNVSDGSGEAQQPAASGSDVQVGASAPQAPAASVTAEDVAGSNVNIPVQPVQIKEEMEDVDVEEISSVTDNPMRDHEVPGTSASAAAGTASVLEAPSRSYSPDIADFSRVSLANSLETTTEVIEESEDHRDGATSDQETPVLTTPLARTPSRREAAGAELGKRERKKTSHPDFVDWRDFQASVLVNPEEPGPSPSSSTSAARCRRPNSLSKQPQNQNGAPEETQMQPLQPQATDNNDSGIKRGRRQKRKHFELQLVADDDDDEEVATQSNWEGGSGYISQSEMEGGTVRTKRRSMRITRRSHDNDQHRRSQAMESPAPGKLSRGRRRGSSAAGSMSTANGNNDPQIDAFPEAPQSSVEKAFSSTTVPILSPSITKSKFKRKSSKPSKKGDEQDQSDDYCFICLDGGDIVCCDNCPKVYHLGCHIPVLDSEPDVVNWSCNHHVSKRTIDKMVLKYPDSGENSAITQANKRHFPVACKFLMECYKIKELPTMRWRFPAGYLKVYGKAPYNLQYIKGRLCLGDPEPFGSVEEMLLAFKQMFTQAFMYLEKYEPKYLGYADTYVSEVLKLVDDYYPAHADLFDDLLFVKKTLETN